MKVRLTIEYDVEIMDYEIVTDELGLDKIEEICDMEEVDFVLDNSRSYAQRVVKVEMV